MQATYRTHGFRTLAARLVFTLGLVSGITLAHGQSPRIISRPLTPQEITNYGLPSSTQTSGGLNNVGLGAPVYLEAQVPLNTTVIDVTWTLASKPSGSAAVLSANPLGSSVPIYNPGDRSVFAAAGRTVLVPDVLGQYTVNATVVTSTGNVQLSTLVSGAKYVGVGETGLMFHDPPQCALCHPDKVLGWQDTKHATAMKRRIDGVDTTFFRESCLKCHNTGFDSTASADNGGFDDIARMLNWVFPTTIQAGNWDAMPADLKGIANVQCESCHGPGEAHVRSGGNPAFITRSTSSGDCGQCHDAEPYHTKNQQWNLSRHAVTTRYPTGESRSACVGCHSGVGFIDRMAGLPQNQQRTAYEAIVCATCHDPHSATNPHQLRRIDTVTLMNGAQVDVGGKGRLCMNCHIARRDAETYVLNTAGSGGFGPHNGPQTDMLIGTNAVQYGRVIPSSAHKLAVSDSCVTCHMQPTPGNGSTGHNMVGGHTFKPTFDNGTPDNLADDVHLTTACASCHGPMPSFDMPRQDYDGNGVIQGVQTEVRGLLDRLALLLPPVNNTNVTVTSAYTTKQRQAVYNYLFVLRDGSFGIHNTSYAVNILKASIADLTGNGAIIGDEDNDTLPDSWELQHFGNLTSQNANGDADGDGLSNIMEYSVGSSPKLADSDSDGFSDWTEIHTGTNPLDAGDNPQVGRSSIHHAAEMLFITEPGKTYQIQSIQQLGTGQSWSNVGAPVQGTGQMIQHFISTRDTQKGFYRVIQVPQP